MEKGNRTELKITKCRLCPNLPQQIMKIKFEWIKNYFTVNLMLSNSENSYLVLFDHLQFVAVDFNAT